MHSADLRKSFIIDSLWEKGVVDTLPREALLCFSLAENQKKKNELTNKKEGARREVTISDCNDTNRELTHIEI